MNAKPVFVVEIPSHNFPPLQELIHIVHTMSDYHVLFIPYVGIENKFHRFSEANEEDFLSLQKSINELIISLRSTEPKSDIEHLKEFIEDKLVEEQFLRGSGVIANLSGLSE